MIDRIGFPVVSDDVVEDIVENDNDSDASLIQTDELVQAAADNVASTLNDDVKTSSPDLAECIDYLTSRIDSLILRILTENSKQRKELLGLPGA